MGPRVMLLAVFVTCLSITQAVARYHDPTRRASAEPTAEAAAASPARSTDLASTTFPARGTSLTRTGQNHTDDEDI